MMYWISLIEILYVQILSFGPLHKKLHISHKWKAFFPEWLVHLKYSLIYCENTIQVSWTLNQLIFSYNPCFSFQKCCHSLCSVHPSCISCGTVALYGPFFKNKKIGMPKDNKYEWKSGLFLLKWRNKSIKLRISLIYSRKTCYKHSNRNKNRLR